jgi:hypothetical protein
LRLSNVFLLISFLNAGISFWFWKTYETVFWQLLFLEISNTLYVCGWMFLAFGLNQIDRNVEEQ